MPYFILQVKGAEPENRTIRFLQVFENYRDARTHARKERAKQPDTAPETIRVVFADSQELAEGLLRQRREAPILQEWEK